MATITEYIETHWDQLSQRAQQQAIASGRVVADQWELLENGYHYSTVTADSADEALEEARDNVDAANYTGYTDDHPGKTLYIDVKVRNTLTGETASDTVVIEPDEPDCTSDDGHDWRSPYSVLGGIAENPGVQGNGGGAIIREVCAHCGVYRITDTWAQRRDTGEQGLTEVSYEDSDDESLAWVRARRDNG